MKISPNTRIIHSPSLKSAVLVDTTLLENPKLLSYFCKIVHGVRTLPIEFHPTKKRTKLVVKPGWMWKWNNRTHAFWVFASLTQMLVINSKTPLEGVLAWLGVCMEISTLIFIHEERKKAVEIPLLCNAIFDFDIIYPSSRKHTRTLNDEGSMILLYCMVISPTILPIGYVYGLHLMNPCKVSLVGSRLIPECNENISLPIPIGIAVKCGVFIVNHWLWLTSICSATFVVSVVNTMSVNSIHRFIERFSLAAKNNI